MLVVKILTFLDLEVAGDSTIDRAFHCICASSSRRFSIRWTEASERLACKGRRWPNASTWQRVWVGVRNYPLSLLWGVIIPNQIGQYLPIVTTQRRVFVFGSLDRVWVAMISTAKIQHAAAWNCAFKLLVGANPWLQMSGVQNPRFHPFVLVGWQGFHNRITGDNPKKNQIASNNPL